MIEQLDDRESYRRRRASTWKKSTDYWLTQPLRHVDDVGLYILDRVLQLLARPAHLPPPTLVDMGCGNCWLLSALLHRDIRFQYVGLDSNQDFIETARREFADIHCATFIHADLEEAVSLAQKVDLVVNAFNFFELSDLSVPMNNVASWLCDGGQLLMSTIDKTYLILALSKDWEQLHENLRRYANQQGTKYDFQKIDLGVGLSDSLEYPSVLYSTQDYLAAASAAGLEFGSYVEHAFTAKPIPKIYCHFEFRKGEVKR